jgi:hypothetical protein
MLNSSTMQASGFRCAVLLSFALLTAVLVSGVLLVLFPNAVKKPKIQMNLFFYLKVIGVLTLLNTLYHIVQAIESAS